MPEQRVLLHNISWDTYEALLADCTENPGVHLTYDCGELEFLSVNLGHEHANRTLERLATIVAVETAQDIFLAGSTTFKRRDISRGFEPDSSLYIQNATAIRGKDDIDPLIDPPPDLVVEVDIIGSSLDRLSLFAAFGIPEVWRYNGKRIAFHRLAADGYRQLEESLGLPPMTSEQAAIFLDRCSLETAPDWESSVREWIRSRV